MELVQYIKSEFDCQEESTLVDSPYLQTGLSISVYNNSLTLDDETAWPDGKPRTLAHRSEVTQFTRKSRANMFRTLSKLQAHKLSKGAMYTLTYHWSHTKAPDELRNDLKRWLQWCRDQLGNVYYIWRIEFQQRGAIHFHILMWADKSNWYFGTEQFNAQASNHWHSIADPTSDAHAKYGFQCSHITNYRHACSYVAKYVAKVSDEREFPYTGRRWAASYNLPTRPGFEMQLDRQSYNILHQIIISLIRPYINPHSRFALDLESYYTLNAYISPARLLAAVSDYNTTHPPNEDIMTLEVQLSEFCGVISE